MFPKILIVILAATSILTSIYYYARIVRNGVFVLNNSHPTNVCVAGALNYQEFLATKWMKKHSKKDAVFISNRQDMFDEDGRFFYFTAFSERRSFLEGYNYSIILNAPGELSHRKEVINKVFYNHEKIGLDGILRANNIEYLIISRCSHIRVTRSLTDFDTQLKMVFRNNDVQIFALKPSM